MCNEEFKFLLLIVFILFCISSSGTEDKMIVIQEKGCHYYNYSCQYNYYWYTVGWMIDDWDDDSCINSGLIFGSICIITAIITFCLFVMLLYFRLNLKNYNKVFGCLYQRQFIIVTCIILMALTGPSAGLFFSNCSDVLWEQTSNYNDVRPIFWAPDYGLIIAWVGCGILSIIPFFNLCLWNEETVPQTTPQTVHANKSNQVNERNNNGLPNGWRKLQASDGRMYYQNDTTKVTQWERPENSTNIVVLSESIPQQNQQTVHIDASNEVQDDSTCLYVAAGFSFFFPVIGFTMMCVYACGKSVSPQQAKAYRMMCSCTALGVVVGCIVVIIQQL